MIDALLDIYGQEMAVTDREGKELRRVRGFLQPLHFGERDGLWEETPGGAVSRARYLLIAGQGAFDGAETEEFVLHEGARYRVLRADRLDAIRGVEHWEAVLRREGEAKA